MPKDSLTEGWRDRVRAAMGSRGWGQADLAREVGTTQTRVARWLAGDDDPGIENGFRIAQALGVGAEALFLDPGPG